MDAQALPDIDSLWDYQQPAATAERFRELRLAAAGRASRSYLAQLLSQLARTHSLRSDFSKAHSLLDESETLVASARTRHEPEPDITLAQVRIMLERGRSYNSGGAPQEAVAYFTRAFDTAVAAGLESYAVDAVHMLAIAEPGEAGLNWNLRGIALAGASPSPAAQRWLGPLLNNTGWSYHNLERYPEALEYFERSRAFREMHGGPYQLVIARWCVARCLRSLGRLDEALAQQQALAADLAASGQPEDGYVSEELGECLLALGQPASAAPHFARAWELLSQDKLNQREAQRLARLEQLGASAAVAG